MSQTNTPDLSLMTDKEYCRYMIGLVDNDLVDGYIPRVQKLAAEAGYHFNPNAVSQTRTLRVYNRILAHFINMAGLQIRQESAMNSLAV